MYSQLLMFGAVRAGRMYINKDGEVYILISEVTDQNLEQLRSTDVTVELHDKGQRIVQARVKQNQKGAQRRHTARK